MIKGCRIFDGELAVSTGPGPMEIGVGEALPGGKKLLGRRARWEMQKVCKEGLSTPPSNDCTLSFSSPAPKTAIVI